MKRIYAVVAVIFAVEAVFAVPTPGKARAVVRDWENIDVNSLNRMPAATYAMPLANARAALTDALEFETPWKMSLNGTWKFHWSGDPLRRPLAFEKPSFDVSKWETIDVPCCVEMRGYGMPHYIAHGYPHKFAWPKILDKETGRPDYNPVMSYKRKFRLPDSWKGRETILRFEGAGSALYAWINGEKVGYAEDSKLPSEFNITPFLKDGENEIAVQVFRWCDGSYVEDQDMLRFSGLFRDVSLWSRPKAGIADFVVTQKFGEGYKSATVDVEVTTYGDAKEVSATLYGAEFKEVGRGDGVGDSKRTTTRLGFKVENPNLWSAEKPYLYTLVLKCGDDIRAKRIGLKEQKIVGEVFYVNGKPIKFKGVNRHETSPENGRTVSCAEMLRDAELMKRYNIDTVRTSHYPNHRLWYDICDRYGIYLVAEANVEAHGAGFGKDGFGPIKEWKQTIVERNERQVRFYRNNPSVTIWSMGNETKHGDNFRAAIAAVRKIDPSRPIHWEVGAKDADMDASMYRSVEQVEKLGAAHDAARDKPFFHTEYAHAMGNAIGNFQEYWDVTYAHPSLIGGCIWDWKDQAIWAGTGRIDPKTGREERYLAYGGDFYDNPHNGPICQNGVVGPLAEVTPKLIEVGHVHRNLVVERGTGNVERGTGFGLWNRFAFTWADEFDGRWQLVEDGVEVASGRVVPAHIAPLLRGDVTLEGLDAAIAKGDGKKERFVNVSFATKRDMPWAKAGWVVARDQIALGGGKAVSVQQQDGSAVSMKQPLAVKENDRSITVECGGTVAVFSRKSGLITQLTVKGVAVLKEVSPGVPAGPHLTCVRAFVDNDKWLKDSFLASGLMRLGYHPEPIIVEDDAVKTVVNVTGTKGCGFKHECTYRFSPDGSVTLENTVTPYGVMPKALPRLGLTMRLDPALERIRYYGRGPWENYIDRCTGSFVGLYESTVAEQYVDYVRPQDNGYKSGVRWAEFTDGAGKGVRFEASEPLFMQALHYGWEDIFLARHDGWQKHTLQIRRYAPPVAQRDVILNLDVRQTGLGGASVGPATMEKYRFNPSKPVSWTLVISPGKCVGKDDPCSLTTSVQQHERTASVYHSYEFEPIADTPPPSGFKPFYISHYGRHGSRHLTGSAVSDVMSALEKADKRNALTETGRSLLADMRKIAAVHDDMKGQLTERGAWELKRLARRMVGRFPEVFSRPRRVHCRSSVSPRVLTSQANFTMALKGVVPQLEFDFATGERHHKVINPLHWARMDKPDIAKRTDELAESLAKGLIDPKPLVERIFTAGNPPKKPLKFAQALFECASICQCCRCELGGLDIYRFLEAGEIEALSRSLSASHYMTMGNSEEFGEFVSASEAKLGRDMAARAEAAIADDRIAADLRFGHDSGLWPLAGFLGLEGPGDRVKAADSPSSCPSWKWLPMAANFQMILYRNAAGEILVKFLWNEREMRVRGVKPVSGPYYKWSDIQPRMEGNATRIGEGSSK